MTLTRRSADYRTIAVATCGFASFVNLYSPQALLPELAQNSASAPARSVR